MSDRDRELRDLICKLSDGTLTPGQGERLNELLKEDSIAQEAYLDHLVIDALLEREFGGTRESSSLDTGTYSAGLEGQNATFSPAAGTEANRLSSSKRVGASSFQPSRYGYYPWVAAAALFVAMVPAAVWFVSQFGTAVQQPLVLSDAGFESESPLSAEAGATVVSQWYGEAVECVEEFGGVNAVEGRKMLRFVKSAAEPDNECEIYQVVDVRSLEDINLGDAVVEASAQFNSLQGDEEGDDYTFGITVYSLSEEPSDETNSWPMRWQQPLTFSGRQMEADTDPDSWQQVATRLALPEDTKFLVVQLTVIGATADADSPFPGQFADNVKLKLAAH